MSIAVIPISQKQQALAKKVKENLNEAELLMPSREASLKSLVAAAFKSYRLLVLIMPTGVAVRLIAPYLSSKLQDPGVVVVDTAGRYAISLCGGHEGGANSLSYQVAKSINAFPIVTTGSEVRKSLIVGIGCRRGQQSSAIVQAFTTASQSLLFSPQEVRCLATATLKKNEQGLNQAAEKLNLPLVYQPLEKIKLIKVRQPSEAAQKHLQVDSVCEAAALLTAAKGKLVLPRTNFNGISLAIVRDEVSW